MNREKQNIETDIRDSEIAGLKKKLKEFETKFSELTYKYEVVANNPYNMEYWIDETGKIVYLSPSCERVTGYSKESFLNGEVNFDSIVYEEDKEKWKNHSTLATSSDQKPVEIRIVRKNGKVLWIEHACKRVIDPDGNFRGFRASNRIINREKTTREELEKLKEKLEQKIQKRTNELIKLNERLFAEVEERKKSEQTAFENEQRYKRLLTYSPNAIIVHTENKILFHNEAAQRIIGAEKDESFVGKSVLEFVHPDHRELIKRMISVALKRKRNIPFNELKIKSFDGKEKFVEIGGAPVNFWGQPALQTVMRDITENKKNLAEINETKNKYQKLAEELNFVLDNMRDFVYRQDVNGKFTFISPAIESITGFTPEEWHTNYETVLTDNPINKKVVEFTEDALLRGVQHPPYEAEVYHKNGNRIILEVSEIPLMENGKPGGIIGVARDITERKKYQKLEKSLYAIASAATTSKSTRELYKNIHEIIKDLMPAKNFYIALHDKIKNVMTFPYHVDEYDESPTGELPFGRGLSEYVLRTKKSQLISKQRDMELQQSGEVELSGEYAAIWLGIYLNFEGNYKGVFVVQDYEDPNAFGEKEMEILEFVSDQIVKVIDKKIAEEKLQQYNEELTEAKRQLEITNKNKDKFFSIIAHDLKNPFMSILGTSKLLSDSIDNLTMKELTEISETMYSSSENLYKLLENLLSWSRLQLGNTQIDAKKLTVKPLVENIYKIFELTARNKNIEIVNSVDKEISIYADEDCFRTILRNLISNALKFSNPGGTIVIKTDQKENGTVRFSVADNGIGMEQETLEKLFVITEKVTTRGTKGEKGTGLGLLLCKDLVERNNGTISVESEPNKGTTFYFTLPSEAAESENNPE